MCSLLLFLIFQCFSLSIFICFWSFDLVVVLLVFITLSMGTLAFASFIGSIPSLNSYLDGVTCSLCLLILCEIFLVV